MNFTTPPLEDILVTFNDSYKHTKERFVTGYTGTSGAEVAMVVAILPVSSTLQKDKRRNERILINYGTYDTFELLYEIE